MVDQPQQIPPAIDPDSVQETLCDGNFNLSFSGQLATLTFTHWRPDVTQMFAGTVDLSAIVRARIVLTMPNLLALRDFLVHNLQVQVGSIPEPPAPATGGATKH
jgi:hypothetical protein